MPRGCRCLSSSGVYHVMVRGNEKKNIFLDDKDRLRFINIIREKKKSDEFDIYAFCLMDNHAHMLIKEEIDDISRIMRRINTSYANYFNIKYDRVGHVFQGRYISEAIEDDRYLLAAVRYIHNNPVKAGIVKEPQEFTWSSYNSYLGKESFESIISIDEILGMFSKDVDRARDIFIKYSMEKVEDVFIDIKEEKFAINRYNAQLFIEDFLKQKDCDNIGLLDRDAKKELVLELKNKSSLSIRRIAYLLGVDRNFVQRAR